MKPSRYVITGMRKCRQAAHSPILLYWHITDPEDMERAQAHFSGYENFALFPITEGVFRKLQTGGLSWKPKIDDFSVLPLGNGKNHITLCTEAEFFFTQARKLITTRGVVVLRLVRRYLHQPLGQPHP